MTWKLGTGAVLIIGSLIVSDLSVAQEPLAGITNWGDQGLLAVAVDGDWYSGDTYPPAWAYGGNIYESSGQIPIATIVACANQNWNGNRPLAIDALGNVFAINVQNSEWSYEGNIGTIAGHQPDGQFITLATYETGIRLVAVTDAGDLYERVVNQDWHYIDDILESVSVSVPVELTAAPGLVLSQPNPFNPTTAISYEVYAAGPVRLQVFDLDGRLVRTLVNELMPAGHDETQWDGRGDDGRELPSAVYLLRLEAGGKVATGRMTLVR
jgi:hypothetical protein